MPKKSEAATFVEGLYTDGWVKPTDNGLVILAYNAESQTAKEIPLMNLAGINAYWIEEIQRVNDQEGARKRAERLTLETMLSEGRITQAAFDAIYPPNT